MKYLKKFNESLSKPSFKEKYAKEIASGDIEVKIVDSWLEIKVKDGSTLPELEELEIKRDKDTYWLAKPSKSNIGDYIVLDVDSLKKLLNKTPEEIKKELQDTYDKKFRNDRYLRDMKIRKLFVDYLSSY